MTKILIVEDEESILMALEDDLRLEGYDVTGAKDGQEGFSLAKERVFDLIILDIMLPGLSGLEVCKQLRQAGIWTPIVMLTAKSQEVDKVLGLELGADDYVTKPFSSRELLSRIKAILRRSSQIREGIDSYQFDDVSVDFKKYEAMKNGRPLSLTALEYSLLHLFITHRNEVLTRDTILDRVWGEDVHVVPRVVDTHIAHLRKKIERDPAHPKIILGVRGVGYKFIS